MTLLRDNEALLQWSLSALGLPGARDGAVLECVAGDASSRRYFRLVTERGSVMLVDAPPATEKNDEFFAVQERLQRAGVRVPAIYACDRARGFMAVEDLGDDALLPHLNNQTVGRHYTDAFELLQRFAQVDVSGLPAYDDDLLTEELGRFPQWFIAGLLGHELDGGERELLKRVDRRLIESALEQPRLFVHRDFHSRNLMLLGRELAVIDFQDAVVGPVTYDLVSLLRDCYIQWPAQQVESWALEYRERLLASSAVRLPDEEEFLRWFDLMGLQRHLKVLGTFARLFLRDGKSAYLNDLPLVVHYCREVVARHAAADPLFAQFGAWFDGTLVPLIETRDWSLPA